MTYPTISIVVIGYNEAANLHKTFDAIKCINYPKENIELIYVDSGSSDDSVQIANLYTNNVFIENKFPSPGRNRNRGLIEAKSEIVHFIDGDVIIDPNYLMNIIPLFKEKNADAIVGQLDEQNPNIYNRIASLSNAKKEEGYTKATSTGATYIKKALILVNGYDERIKRGQETELGERFREAGYKIWCTRFKMGSHNFDIHSITGLLKKSWTKGRSSIQVYLMNGRGLFFKKNRRTVHKLIAKHIITFILLLFAVFFNKLLVFLLLYFLLFIYQSKKLIFKSDHQVKLMFYALVVKFLSQYLYFTGMIFEFTLHLVNRKKVNLYNLQKDVLI